MTGHKIVIYYKFTEITDSTRRRFFNESGIGQGKGMRFLFLNEMVSIT